MFETLGFETLTAPQVAYILGDCGAKTVFVSDAVQMAKVLEAAGECEQEMEVVVFDAPGDLVDGHEEGQLALAESIEQLVFVLSDPEDRAAVGKQGSRDTPARCRSRRCCRLPSSARAAPRRAPGSEASPPARSRRRTDCPRSGSG